MTHNFTFFWQNRSPFSNWYPSVFTHNGITFTRGEQYMMYQKHEKGSGPRLEGTEGKLVLPDFAVWNKNPVKGNFLVDVKVKTDIYPVNGKRCFTVDRKFEDYKRCADVMKMDFLMILFIYEGKFYVYKGNEVSTTTVYNNGYGSGTVYCFEYNKNNIRY